jgi:hypothetical protein
MRSASCHFLFVAALAQFLALPLAVRAEVEAAINPDVLSASDQTAETISDIEDLEIPVATHVDSTNLEEMTFDAARNCACESCQASAKQQALKKAVASAYSIMFFNNKFDYLCDPEYCDWHLGEDLKRICIGECSVLDIGGQYRARFHNERNHRGVGLTGLDDDFLLHRTRLYMNDEFGDRVRIYAEMMDAESNYENFAPRVIEVNRTDMQNLFADVKLLMLDGGDVWARVGRQELLHGSQRLVSPLDWANTRRNFEGVTFFYKGPDWNIDAFLTHPIVPDPNNFDTGDENQDFCGLFTTYKGRTNETVDFYYLHYRNDNAPQGPNGLYFETIGSRWQGTMDQFLWDFEGGYQFGKNRDDSNHDAGFMVAGLGRKIDHCWKPTLWLYYDWSSGGNLLAGRQGFDHLFPLGHRYHGFMDLYARSNIEAPNLLLTFQPREKLQALIWYHYFFLENKNDTPYNITMTAFNPTNAPASASLGHEIDTTLQWNITPRVDLLFGYSHFFAGNYYKLTPGVPYRSDADFFYTQFTVNF